MPAPTISDLAAAVADLSARVSRLERNEQFGNVRKTAQAEIDQVCANHGVRLPAPDSTGTIDASAALADLRSRPGFADGKHEKAAADQLERLLRNCGWAA